MNDRTALVSGTRLAKNTVWNLLGNFLPLVVGLAAIPPLIGALGKERFGILTIAWMVVGYFSLFDLGLGRALTKSVAEKIGTPDSHEIAPITWTVLLLMALFGFAGMLVLGGFTPWLVHRGFNIPEDLRLETVEAFYILALSIPMVVTTAGLRGFLEAYQRFDLVNYVRVPIGVFTFLGPLLTLLFSTRLTAVIGVLVLGRVCAWIVYFWMCLQLFPALRHCRRARRDWIRPLLSYGSWMTVTNVIGPIMVSMDRLLIGAMLSMTAVTYYTTPYEFITKLWLVPSALVGVLFPAFAATFSQDRTRTVALFGRGVDYVFFAIFPITLIVVAFAQEGLLLWLGPDFATHSAPILQWLAIGTFLNCLAYIPSGLIQGMGRPDLAAKAHLLELPIYLLLLWGLLRTYGILGVAMAWVIRVFLDTGVFFAIGRALLPEARPLVQRIGLRTAVALVVLIVAVELPFLWAKGIFTVAVLLGFAGMVWFILLSQGERAYIRRLLWLSSTKGSEYGPRK